MPSVRFTTPVCLACGNASHLNSCAHTDSRVVVVAVPAHDASLHKQLSEPSGPISPEEFIVERIMSHRFNVELERLEYFVRWEGYGPEYDTWEPVDCFVNGPCINSVLIQYWIALEQERKRRNNLSSISVCSA